MTLGRGRFAVWRHRLLTKVDAIKLVAWRQGRNASIAETAKRWNVSEATVKRLSREHGEAAKAERQRYQMQRLDEELQQHEYELRVMFLGQRNRHLNWVDMWWHRSVETARGTPNEAAVIAAREEALEKADRDFREEWESCMGPLSELMGPR